MVSPNFVVKHFHGSLHHSVEHQPDVRRIAREDRALEVARIAISPRAAELPIEQLIRAYKTETLHLLEQDGIRQGQDGRRLQPTEAMG
jgi:hypothetical protein